MSPICHHQSPFFDHVCSAVGAIHVAPYFMPQSNLCHFAGMIRAFCNPIPERRADDMWNNRISSPLVKEPFPTSFSDHAR